MKIDELLEKFIKVEPIYKGSSKDKKYHVENINGIHMFLRVSDVIEYNLKKTEYDILKSVYKLGVLVPQPLEFGLCDNGEKVYSLTSWLNGKDAKDILPYMSKKEQYILGLKASEVLHKIHTLPTLVNVEAWDNWFINKIQKNIDFYNANFEKFSNGDLIINYLQNNRFLLENRPQTLNHGDPKESNYMVMPDGQIGMIDFNANNHFNGDPWIELYSTNWGNEPNSYFCTGLIKGYFKGEPPNNFFKLFLYYLAYDALNDFCKSFENEHEKMDCKMHMERVLRWFNNLKNLKPLWYQEEINF